MRFFEAAGGLLAGTAVETAALEGADEVAAVAVAVADAFCFLVAGTELLLLLADVVANERVATRGMTSAGKPLS